jgi:phosphoenolpyruvate synthase/pyruvate phosphate dikinase
MLTKTFSKLNKNLSDIAGGKGASLGEMTNVNIPVPHGFVVLSGAFQTFLEFNELNVEIDTILESVNHKDTNTINNASEKIQALILNAKFPGNLKQEVEENFQKLDCEFVAVRSSATAEDGKDHAWAGQLNSYLNTKQEGLLENIKKCFASLFTPRAIFYRFEKELHKTKISVAVVVQKMIQSEVSGVAFSVHPITEDRNQILIEAGYGLGEAIVSGSITPDSYVIHKNDLEIIDKNVYTQTKGIYKGKSGDAWLEIVNEKQDLQKLSDEQIVELAKLVVRIENHYGFPCDIEWGLENGKFHILQSRPITTLSVKTENNNVDEWVFSKNDFVFTFESGGTTFLFEDIVIQHYMNWESLTLAKGLNVRVFVPKKAVEKMNSFGSKITIEFIKEKMDGVMTSFRIMESGLENLKQIKQITLQETHKVFEPLKILCESYSFFDIHYSDGMFINRKLTEAGQFVQKNKNILREAMNMPFFDESGWMQTGLNKISEKFNLSKETLTWYSENEIYELFNNKKVAEQTISQRKISYTCYINEKLERGILEGNKSSILYTQFEDRNIDTQNQITGMVANNVGTRISGTVRKIKRDFSNPNILLDGIKSIKEDDILVTDTTDPDFLPAMKIAKGIITDVGGMLSHASISSRELNKPCIVGTVFASKILSDGDLIEMDLINGNVFIKNKSVLKINENEYDFLWRVYTWFPFCFMLWESGYQKGDFIFTYEEGEYFAFVSKKERERLSKKTIKIYTKHGCQKFYLKSKKISDKAREEFEKLGKLDLSNLSNIKLASKFLKMRNEALKLLKVYFLLEYHSMDLVAEKILEEGNDEIKSSAQFLGEFKLEMRKVWGDLLEDNGLLPRFLGEAGKRLDIGKKADLFTIQELCNALKGLKNDFSLDRNKGYVWGQKIGGVKTGNEAVEIIRQLWKKDKKLETLSGQIAQKGFYKGKVKKIDYGDYDGEGYLTRKIDAMEKGDVLVVGSTSPEFIIACKKAGAIITDEGGVISHAAIISRELKIPCIIGTKYGTAILNDGDLVEVDANNGIIRIIK